ncbi:MAG: NADPH:quinone reductase [Phycisphaerae bacterium]
MRAIRVHEFGGPEVLKVEEVATPKPGKGQVLIGVKAVGINPVETYIRSGKYGEMHFPYTPGKDCAGVVEGVGEGVEGGVEGFKVGDRVFTDGTVTGAYAEKTVARTDTVHFLAGRASFEQGAAVGVPAGVAYYALMYRGGGRAGETVLIHGGTGGVGPAAIQMARAAGFYVVATAGDEKGRAFVLEQGAHAAADHKITERPEELQKLTGGRGVDIILEMLANVNLESDLKVLNKRGRVMVIGSRGRIEIDPRETMKRDADIRGVMLGGALPEEHRGIYAAVAAGLENGTLRPVIGMRLKLEEAAKAHREVMEGESFGKIVLLPTE